LVQFRPRPTAQPEPVLSGPESRLNWVTKAIQG